MPVSTEPLVVIPPPEPVRVGVCGALARDAEVQQLTDGSCQLVVELAHTPPVIAMQLYPGGEARHASYIAATERARHFRQHGNALVIGSGIHQLGKWRGRPCLTIINAEVIAALESSNKSGAHHAYTDS